MILSLIRANSLTDPRQRISDELVNHAGATEPGVHHDYPYGLLPYLVDDLGPRTETSRRSRLVGVLTALALANG